MSEYVGLLSLRFLRIRLPASDLTYDAVKGLVGQSVRVSLPHDDKETTARMVGASRDEGDGLTIAIDLEPAP